MTGGERAIAFECRGDRLIGILHETQESVRRGVLIIVGGPQYRAGSHRQFVSLARRWCQAGIPVFRFDYRGMGDSEGQIRDFEQVDDDIAAAIDRFMAECPDLEEVVLWGLCDGASAAAFFGQKDPRVRALVMVNPWVRSEEIQAQATLKFHYGRKFTSMETWRRLFSGKISVVSSLGSIVGAVGATFAARVGAQSAEASLPDRVLGAMARFPRPVLLFLSGNDLTAREFLIAAESDGAHTEFLASDQVTRHDLPQANHTFSEDAWRNEIAERTINWIDALPA